MQRSILAILASFLLACGSTSSNDPDADDVGDAASLDAPGAADAAPPDAMPNPTLDDLCGLDGGYASFFDALLACNPEFEFYLGRFPTHEEISAACYGHFGDYFGDGTMALGDAEAWAACLDYLDSLDCTTADFDAPNPCDSLIIGSQDEGEDCEVNEQCAGNAYCDLSGGGDCGVCTPKKPDWQPCQDGVECLNGLCDSAQSVCRPFGQVGAVCGADSDCSGRLLCDADDTGLCVEPPVWELGDDCTTFTDDCGFPFSELFCDIDGLGGTNKCVNYFDVGDDCISSYQCDFRRYEICDTADTGKCLAPTIVNENDSCSWAEGTKCDAGFRCTDPTGDTGICVAEPQEGDDCGNDDQCGILMSCTADGKCGYGDYTGMCPDLG